LVALLVAGILLPGVILAVFGFGSLRQDRLLAERQSRDALISAAELAAREANREIARWREWQDAEGAEVVFREDGGIASSRGLLWLPGGTPAISLGPDADRAEQAEIRQRDYAKALSLYELALRGASANAKAAVLLRIARTAQKSGDHARAVRAWREVLSLPASPSSAAALLSLVESGAASATEAYRTVATGRLPLSREDYFFHAGRLKELAGANEVAGLAAEELRRTALTEAAEAFLDRRSRTPSPGFLAFRDEERASILPEERVRERLTLAAQAGLDAPVTLALRSSAQPAGAVARALEDAALPWRVEAAPRNAAALERSLRNRQRLLFAGLAIVLAALVSGVGLTWRALRREARYARLQSDFVATVSHEFRSPLTGIRQLAELLDSGVARTDERRGEYYRLILQESDRLTRLVENLLDFSRLAAGQKQYRPGLIDSSEWLEATAAAPRNPRIATKIPPGLPRLRGDRDALSSAVANLIDNALKYSPPESRVEVAAAASGGALSIFVTDRGPGIAAEEQGRIFERFYRGRGPHPGVKGAGIGLSLVRRIVEDHGGTVSVASRPGEGSTFTIDLKTAEGESE
jgi:signal transduction histidine kinase